MQIKTKELIIPKEFMEPEWQTTKVKIRKWNMQIRNEIIDQVTDFQVKVGKKPEPKLQGGFSQILVITKCILEAPWKVGTVAEIGELNPEFGDWLYGEITNFNSGGVKNPQDLAESSAEK